MYNFYFFPIPTEGCQFNVGTLNTLSQTASQTEHFPWRNRQNKKNQNGPI
jgi:hypothetical protein